MVIFVQKLRVFVRKRPDRPTDSNLVAMLEFIDLSLRPNLVLIVTLATGHGFVDPQLVARSGDRPVWIALGFRTIKLKLIGSLTAVAVVAMPQAAMHTGSLAVATVMWQLAIVLRPGVLGVLLGACGRLDMESSKE